MGSSHRAGSQDRKGIDRAEPWFSEYGIQQTRGFRALKVWLTIQHFGLDGYREVSTRSGRRYARPAEGAEVTLAAVVSGVVRLVLTASGTPIDVRVRFTELWTQESGSWRMVLWHAAAVS